MKKQFKRFLSMTLAMVLVLSCVPATVFAEETTTEPTECSHSYGEPVVTEATCGAVGARVYTCTEDGCDYSYEETIPATGAHVYEAGRCTCGAVDPAYVEPVGETEPDAESEEETNTPPKAEVTVLEPITLEGDSYMIWPSGDDTIDRPLQAVMNFKTLETTEEARPNGYLGWKCDFYLTFEGLPEAGLQAEDCYLAGNYGDFGWIVIPADELFVENNTEYPVVAAYDANITYKQICDSVKNFTAALYVAPKILSENPNFKVKLALKMTNPEDATDVLTIGEPAVYTAKQLMHSFPPKAEVTVLDPMTLTEADDYMVWPSGDDTIDRPLQAVMNFKTLETTEEARPNGYLGWKCDFYLTFEGLPEAGLQAEDCYLAGNYGDFGWIVIPADELFVENNTEYPVVAAYDANITYKQICDSVKNFTAALYVAPKILSENPNFKVKLALKMTNPEDATDVLTIGEPAVYTAKQLMHSFPPKAEVTVLDPMTLTEADDYMVWPSGDDTIDRPLQAVMNFKTLETTEEARPNGYLGWKCDFYLTFEGLPEAGLQAEDCYLAGNYGDFGWIVIPADELFVENNTEYPVVAAYDANITYKQICDSVKNFTAALYVAPKILSENPNFKVKLALKMTNPEDATDVLTIGEPAVYTAEELLEACGIVAQNTATGKLYSSVATAVTEAQGNETVILLMDAEESLVPVYEGVTLDLNGHTLTAFYVTGFGDIVDNSADKSGLLAVASTRFMIREDNVQLPVKNGQGYKFISRGAGMNNTGFNYAIYADESMFAFQPFVDAVGRELMAQGSGTSGVTINVRVSWKQDQGVRTQDFVYNDDLVKQYLATYNPDTGKYGGMFTLRLKNMSNYADLTFTAMVLSDTGVAFSVTDKVQTVDGGETEDTTGNVTTDENNQVVEKVELTNTDEQATAVVAEGTKLEENTTSLTLTVEEMAESTSNITVEGAEELLALDVHVEGVSADNEVPILITLNEVALKNLNQGNLKLYHVENGKTVEMIRVYSLEEVDAHNEFYYDILTGTITMALKSFSEVAVVADTDNAWKGEFDYSWYDANAIELTIANADQLAGFSAIVGGMNGQTQDSFSGKTVKLIADIDLGDAETSNDADKIFYPIGYYNDEGTYEKSNKAITSSVYSFEGTFDGQGHTIKNFYQNTWEMKGDDPYYSATEQYYNDAMGLFGYVVNGTIKNLTVDNFSSDGEFTPTGVIAAYAVNSTFENIAITNCNPRVYNTGNGGIVGIGGNSDDPATYELTFTNITIDNSNKISALWGSYDVACGGLVGMFRGAGHVYMTNCHVAAQMDVYNDVCGNYQYYWYRYSGMMVGTNKNMVTDQDGYTVPDTTKFHAENCTVHFGEWNDYYYCELVDNTQASYTHDHQFSRLEQVKSVNGTTITYLNGTTGTVPASGRANYVVVNGDAATENATCYHFKDGKVWNHEDAGYQTGIDENGDGKDDLKEDKQHIYLPFNQLFTGYGWGVKHIPVYNGDDYAFDGIEILDRPVANSVAKFEKADTAKDSYTTGTTVTIGDLFKAIAQTEDPIYGAKVQVFVSPVGEESTAGGTYAANTADWTKGTLTFTGTGAATITITDYNFCTPTTIEVSIVAREPVVKFATKFTGDFLYRVGNVNTVKLDSLFKLAEDITTEDIVENVDVTIEAVEGTAASGIYTSNETWTNGTIQFSGTGVVKVTIKDMDAFCIPTELYLEVVEAWNTTTVTNAPYVSNKIEYDVVLLNNISGGFTVSKGHSFYGNDFTVTCSGDGSYKSAAVSYGYVTVETGGVLDNVNIICDIFPESYLYTIEMKAGSDGRYPYGYSAVVISGNSTISNCYIEGARNNIQVGDGNVKIENTTVKLGSLSNIHIKSNDSYTVTLHNVTTYQDITTSSYDTSKNVYGFGILVGTNESVSNAKLNLTGYLVQNNWIGKDAANKVSNTYAKTAISNAFSYENFVVNETINTGIVYLNDLYADIEDNRTNSVVEYTLETISISGYTGQVYSIIDGTPSDENTPAGNNNIMPSIVFTGDEENIAYSSKYIEDKGAWENKLTVDLDNIDGGSYNFSFADLKVWKYGVDLEYSVKDANGAPVNKESVITVDQLMSTEYTLVVTDNQIYGPNGANTGTSETRELPFILSATKTSIDPPKFTNAGTATAIRLVEKSGGDWRPAYTVLTGVSVTYWSASEGKVKTVDLSTLYNSGTISSNVWTYTCDDYTLTITGGAVHSDGTTITPVVANNTLYFASTNKAFGTGTTSRNIILTYVFTDKNASTTWNRSETVTYSNLSEYDYNSFKNNGTLTAPSSSSGCVTPDTLITLADDSQVRVDSLTGSEELLVWNLETGKLDSAPILFIDSDHEEKFEIVHLYFSDGTDVKVIYEHGFWDYDLNKYIYLDANATEYIGHTFAKQNGDELTRVKLTNVVVETETTTAWSPVTVGHLCYFVNGMLSMPGGVGGLFNIFDVDAKTMTYDLEAMAQDVETYGLFTYEELNAIEPLSRDMFDAAGGAYLKISIGKGNMTMDDLVYMIRRYSPFFA